MISRLGVLVMGVALAVVGAGCVGADSDGIVAESEDRTPTSSIQATAETPGTDGSEPGEAPGPVTVALAALDGLERLDGETFAVAVPDGRPALVWFWAPWCPNCRAMGPTVAELAAEWEGEVEVVGVAGRGERDDMTEFVADTGTGGFVHVIDPDGSVWSTYEVFSQPAFAFVTTDGEIEVLIGRQTAEEMRRRVARLTGA